MVENIAHLSRQISRRKIFAQKEDGDVLDNFAGLGPKLSRILNLFDLTLLGIGSTLGVGIYVLAGSVAQNIAGPAVCLSFLVAAIASGISALCYAEFGARVPKAGSAYTYCYTSVGELVAFVIGWNLILEYLIGSSSVARALSSNIDTLSNHSISQIFTDFTPINIPHLSPYADWASLGVTLLMTVVLATGVKSSATFTNVFTILNLAVVSFFVVTGISYADVKNWAISTNETLGYSAGQGGFIPYGVTGVMAGAAKCFFGFVGFDSIAAAGEEAKNPKRNIPFSIFLTLLVVLTAYVGVSLTLTLILPYYLQDKDSPLVHAFQEVGQPWAAWIVTIGSVFGLTASLLGSMIPMPRIIYAMAKDGLLFRFLATVHPKFKTPFIATLLSGLFAAIFAMVTELDSLVEMMSIGTLLAYTLVSISILFIRYENKADHTCENNALVAVKQPTATTSRNSKLAISVFCVLTLFSCIIVNYLGKSYNIPLVFILTVLIIIILVDLLYLYWLPRSQASVYFLVPFVPLLPALSIWINVYLMCQLSMATWLRFGLWMIIGFLMYGCYGRNHSNLNREIYSSSPLALDEDLSPLVVNEESS